jgi:type I restriction enzyme S subunit
MPLRDMMSPRRETVHGAEGFAACSPITVHLNGAMSVRGREAAFKGAMFAAYPGDVVFSKIDARNGAIGVVPDTIAKAVVTPEFPVFVPDPDVLDGRFVQRVLRTGHFLTALRAKATGTSGRKRITPEAFLDLRVPLPPIADQRKMVDAHDGLLDQARKLTADADKVEADASTAFEAALGFGAATPLPERPVFIASFKELDRWSHEAILRRAVGGDAAPAHPMVKLAEAVRDLSNGWSPKCLDRSADPSEWGVLKVSAVSSGAFRDQENKALPETLSPRPMLETQVGDVLIARASGDARLVGASAYVAETRHRLMICDKIFRVVFRKPTPVLPEFLANVLKLRSVRSQIEAEFSTESGMMKNVSKPALMALRFPLPPLSVQHDLLDALHSARGKAAQMRRDAAVLRSRAADEFEAAVYGEEAAPIAEVA